MATLDRMLLAAENEMDQDQDEGKFLKALFRSLVMAIKASNAVPGQEDVQVPGSDYSYHALFPEFAFEANEAQGSVLDLINAISRHVDSESASASLSPDAATDPSAFEGLADMVEDLLEEVDVFLQQDSGPVAQAAQVADRLRQVAVVARRTAKSYKSMLAQLQDVPKPQDGFKEEIDNSRETAFTPRPSGKPLWKASTDSSLEAPHPYEEEIRNFDCMPWQLSAPPEATLKDNPEDIASSGPVVMVNTEEELLRMVEQVREELDSEGERVIAVDLEAHSIRSFQGFVCLMQLSTRTQDYLVDTLALRKRMGIMSDLLADHTIVKVFHGAESDIKWLQRDFSLYVVNLFDTFLAAKRLQLPGLSLAHLLDKYCGVKADKSYQLADWRVRPLPDDMIRYAREDTHFLLHIFDRMRQELFSSEGRIGLAGVVDSGRELCCLRYKKEAFDPSGYQLMQEKALRLENKRLRPAEVQVLKALYDWRDKYARLADESTLFVCPDRTLMRIAQMTPQTFNSLQECGHPLPPLVAKNAEAILALVSHGLQCYAGPQAQLETADDGTMARRGAVGDIPEPPHLQWESATEGVVHGPFSLEDDGAGLNSGPSSVAGGGLSRMRASASPFTLSFGNSPFTGAPLPIEIPTRPPCEARTSANNNSMKVARLAASPDQLSTSPVLPTEDLYRTAGWTTPLPSSSYSQQGLNDCGGLPWEFGHQEVVGIAAAGLGMKGSQGLSALPALGNTGLETHRPLSHSMQLSEDLEDGSDDERLAAALRIQEDIATGHRKWGLTGRVEFPEEGVGGDRGLEGDELEDDEDEEAREGAVGAEDEEAMPRSMADIYRISNRNRRRNKEKKKVNEPMGESVEDMEDGAENTALPQTDEPLQDTSSGDLEIDAYFVGAKRKKADADDAVKFMASIGWINGKDLVLPPNPSMAMQAAQGAAMNAGMGSQGAPFGRTSHPLECDDGQAMLIGAYGRQTSDGDESCDGGNLQQWPAGGRPSPSSFRRQHSGNSPPMHGHQGRHMAPRTSSPLAGYSHQGPSLEPPGMAGVSGVSSGYQLSQGAVHSSASNSPRRPIVAQQPQPPLPRRFVDYSSVPASVVSAMSSNLSAYNDPPAPRGPPFHHMPNVPPAQFPPQAPPVQQHSKYNPYLAAQHQMSAMGVPQGMTSMGGQAPSKLNPHPGHPSASSPWRSRPDARGPPTAGLPPTYRWNR